MGRRMRRRALLVVGVVVAAAACSSRRHVAAPGFANGSRLAARYDDVAGTTVLRTFWDRARGEECAFQLLPDGGAACLPASALADGWFADAACSDELVEIPDVPAGRTPAQSLVVAPDDACTQAPTVRALGPVFPTADAWYRKSDGSCVQGHGGTRPATLRRIGDAVPLASFVHAGARVEPGSGGVDAVVLVADDGARLTLFGFDRARAEWAHAITDDDGQRRWWPVHVAYNYGAGAPGTPGTYFADAACAQPTGIKDAFDALCPITTVVEFVPGDACTPFTTRLHAAGAPVDPASLHALATDGSCVAAPPAADAPLERYVIMGGVVAKDALSAASTVELGGARVAQRFDGTPDGAAITPVPGLLHDRQRDVDCEVFVAADGARRCLPPALDAISYADAACTQPIFRMNAPVGCAPPAPPTEVRLDAHALAVLGAVTPSTIYAATGSACNAVGPPPSGSYWFALGAEIAPSAYAPATLHTE